jgi:hypothetical protein
LGPADGEIHQVLQMKTVAPWQLMNFAKSVGIFFVLVSVAWIGANYLIFKDFFIGWPVMVGNVLVSGVGGLWWYKTSHHARFSWDGEGFELQKGRTTPIVKRWKDISQVSLVHEGYGRFAVRLYPQEGNSVDVPASDLGLNPSDFRFEVIDLVRAKA